jgi:enoyl-CoA hydratase/carnithine racemase
VSLRACFVDHSPLRTLAPNETPKEPGKYVLWGTSGMSDVAIERVAGTAVVTMRRAEKRNALSLGMMRALDEALAGLDADREVRVVVIAGEGPAFSAGHDLRELRARDDGDYREIFDQCVVLMERVQSIRQPVIAEVNSVATAAGAQLVATCDLAVASTEARFAMVALSRAIGRKRAMEMLLTGEMIDARTALDWGLVNRVVAPAELRSTTLALASKIAEASGEIVGLGKAAFYRQVDLEQQAAYAYTKDVMVRNAQLENAQEGIGAFIDKRQPAWRS